MKNLIVSILGFRMVPNIQFIKEKRTSDTEFLFISNPEMEEEKIRMYINKALDINQNELQAIVVDKFDARGLDEALKKYDFDKYDTILVNLSEGSIVMASVAFEFFKDFNADIFFIPDKIEFMYLIYPKHKRAHIEIKNKINLEEYITSHGLEIKEGRRSGISLDYIKKFLILFLEYRNPRWWIVSKLRNSRSRRNDTRIDRLPELAIFLEDIDFPIRDPKKEYLTQEEVDFLTGAWFEEYVYYLIKNEFNLSDKNIKTGITLCKEGMINEFDVMFFYNGMLYTIECKTSIKNKESNIMTETIYKVKALQNNLGYYSDSNIFTLSSKALGEVRKDQIERGKVFDIDVYCREDILNCRSMAELLKIEKIKKT